MKVTESLKVSAAPAVPAAVRQHDRDDAGDYMRDEFGTQTISLVVRPVKADPNGSGTGSGVLRD